MLINACDSNPHVWILDSTLMFYKKTLYFFLAYLRFYYASINEERWKHTFWLAKWKRRIHFFLAHFKTLHTNTNPDYYYEHDYYT